ncbi:hypothetical protein AN214_03881 [Pseudoalteromonas sp. P1-9]|uniref:hypothetical protein n=1 Tax=Pseudoalteromonas sp. P1-9 TaxID=1710354 RepID=UPI0007079737|nr:hypothetical protein [Pseudoalteromonas sp. P1-9]KPV94048.1 hypothetical protein AN214_03881 [Pseudoalteromonas sp. P1-9]
MVCSSQLNIKIESTGNGVFDDTKFVYTTASVVPPHLACVGQRINENLTPKSIGVTPYEDGLFSLKDNAKMWMDLTISGLKLGLIDEKLVEQLLSTKQYSMEQITSFHHIGQQFLVNLDNQIEQTKKRLDEEVSQTIGELNNCVVDFVRNSDFSLSVTLDGGDEYGSFDEYCLRLCGESWLAALEINYYDAPKTLASLLYSVVEFLSMESYRMTTFDLYEYSMEHECMMAFDELSIEKQNAIIGLIKQDEPFGSERKIRNKFPQFYEEITEYDTFDWFVDNLKERLKFKAFESQFNAFSDLLKLKGHSRLDAIIEQFNHIKNNQHPLIAHPVFKTLEKVIGLLKSNYKDIDSSCLESASDMYLPEANMITFGSIQEQELLEDHHQRMCDVGERVSFKIDVTNDNVLDELNNIILCDRMLEVLGSM